MNRKLFWIFAISSNIYFLQGIEALPSQGLFYYLKESLNFPVEKIMLLSSLITFAWLVKPLIGYLIDNFFTKRTWIFLALAGDILLSLILGVYSLPIILLVSLLLLNSMNTAFRDVSVDAIMCVEGKAYNATGKIQSIQWIALSLSGLITGVAGGYVAQRWSYRAAFLWLLPIYLLTVLTACFYKEEGRPRPPLRSHLLGDLKKLLAEKKLLIVALFIFLYKFSPSFGPPLFFIKRDVFGWSKLWIGSLASIGTVFEITGALLYYRFSSRIKIKKWLFFSVFLGAVTTLSYLYYTPLTAVIYDILYSLIGMFIFIMVMDFMARSTLKGLEATSFAFLCSISNLALIASSITGAFLLPKVGLPWVIVLSALSSFLCLPLINKIE